MSNVVMVAVSQNENGKFEISDIQGLLLDMMGGLLPEHLSKKECEMLVEEYGLNWFGMMGYDERGYNQPRW